MGKYMRKCSRGIGEVAVMKVTEVVGVRTRARALALAAAAAGAPGNDVGQKRRKVEGGKFHVSYLQLRSRKLILTPAKNKKAAAAAASDAPATARCPETGGNSEADGRCGSSCGAGEWDRVSRCSSNASSEVVAPAATSEKASSRSGCPAPEVDDCSETTACNYDADLQRWRERTPSSGQQERESDDLESTAMPGESGGGRRRNAASAVAAASGRSAPLMPSEVEIEEFFAAAEKQEWQRFSQKYNYDVVKDVPLDGRYEWLQIKP